MKTLIVALALASFNTLAATVEITEIDYYDVTSDSDIIADYGVNPSQNRAWADITLHSPNGPDSTDTYLRAQVPGLSIVGHSVVLDVEGQQIECARFRPSRIFRSYIARPTGNCSFDVKLKKTILDDGFEQRIRKTYVLSLTVK